MSRKAFVRLLYNFQLHKFAHKHLNKLDAPQRHVLRADEVGEEPFGHSKQRYTLREKNLIRTPL